MSDEAFDSAFDSAFLAITENVEFDLIDCDRSYWMWLDRP
jgi:hypothetical protein